MTGLSRLRLNRFFPYRLANLVAVVLADVVGDDDEETAGAAAERRGGWAVVACVDRLLLMLQFCSMLAASR